MLTSEKILEKIVNMFNTGNSAEADSLFSIEYKDYQRPSFITYDGPEEFKQIVKLARGSLQDLHVTIKDIIIQEYKIAVRLSWHGKDDQGKDIERETLDILHIKDSQVISHWGAQSWNSSLKI